MIFIDPVWDDISNEAKDLITRMLTKETARLTAE
jgi:serine/threonine protein kinase